MFKLGLNAKLMRGATGATGTTLVKNIKDLAVSLTKATADATTRAAEGWEVFLATLKSASLTFNMLYDPEDSDFVVFLNAFLGMRVFPFLSPTAKGAASTRTGMFPNSIGTRHFGKGRNFPLNWS